MKRVVITGVGGFIGSHLCTRLLKQGVEVYGVDISDTIHSQFLFSNIYHPIVAEFSQYNKLQNFIDKQVDVFFHFAWAGGLLQKSFLDYDLQLKNAKYACDAFVQAEKLGCKRFVNSGTNNQIEIKQFLNSKDYIPRTTCIYSASKTALELICKTLSSLSKTEYVGAMIPMPYGIGNKSMQLMNIVIKKLMENESPALISGNNLYDIVYIEDIIDAFIAIAERGVSGRTYYFGHRKLKTFRQWMEEVRDIINPNVELRFGEYQDPLNMDYSFVNLDLLYEDTGYEFKTEMREALPQTAEWLKKNL